MRARVNRTTTTEAGMEIHGGVTLYDLRVFIEDTESIHPGARVHVENLAGGSHRLTVIHKVAS